MRIAREAAQDRLRPQLHQMRAAQSGPASAAPPRTAPAGVHAPASRRRLCLATTAPSRLPTTGTVAGAMRHPVRRAASSSSIGSSSFEWKACETTSFWPAHAAAQRRIGQQPVDRRDRPRHRHRLRAVHARRRSTRDSGASTLRTAASVPSNAAMPPPAGSACISRPRVAISRAPSSSVSTPARSPRRTRRRCGPAPPPARSP